MLKQQRFYLERQSYYVSLRKSKNSYLIVSTSKRGVNRVYMNILNCHIFWNLKPEELCSFVNYCDLWRRIRKTYGSVLYCHELTVKWPKTLIRIVTKLIIHSFWSTSLCIAVRILTYCWSSSKYNECLYISKD